MHPLLLQIARRFTEGVNAPLSDKEALEVAGLPASSRLDLLTVAGLAAGVNREELGIVTCGIINAKSGRCPENCAFCAQSAHYPTGAPEYPLASEEKLLQRALELAEAGALRFGIVTSGTRLSERDLDSLCEAVLRIRREVNIRICGSLGQITQERAARLAEAGFTRYHHNLETSASYFPSICTSHAYADDIASLHAARAAGLELCCGGIFGLGESWEQRIELSRTLAELDVNAIPVNFLTPIPGTPLEGRALLSPQEALSVLALLRLMHPRRNILVCGGRTAVLASRQAEIFSAGANGLMIGNYLTTSGSDFASDRAMLQDLGLAMAAWEEGC